MGVHERRMDFNYSDNDYMQKLYEEFRKHVYDNDLTTVSYTTDELLDIYDYAIDSNDSLVQMYVFEVAAALYPGNDFLDERKAFFLAQFDEKAARGMLNRKGRVDSALWKVLEINDSAISTEEWEQKLAELLASDMKFSAEAVIRLVEIARNTDHLDWLIDQVDILKRKAEHPEVVLNEIGHAIYEDGEDPETGIMLAEELTANNPFNPDFWVLLASLQRADDQLSESLASCDYALAIDPDHANALAAKGFVLAQFADRKSLQIAAELLEKARKQLPDDSYLLERLAQTYSALNKKTLAGEVYLDLMKRHHSLAIYALSRIADISQGGFTKAIPIFATAVGDNERDWMEVARLLIAGGDDNKALTLLKYYYSNIETETIHPLYLELLYKEGKYREYIKVFVNHFTDQDSFESSSEKYINLYPLNMLMLASAYYQTGDKENAKTICLMLQDFPRLENLPSDFVLRRGIETSLMILENLIEKGKDTPDPGEIDPLMVHIRTHK